MSQSILEGPELLEKIQRNIDTNYNTGLFLKVLHAGETLAYARREGETHWEGESLAALEQHLEKLLADYHRHCQMHEIDPHIPEGGEPHWRS